MDNHRQRGEGMKRENTRYGNRYKYKLNMLEPGLVMIKIVGALFVLGVIFWAASWRWLSTIALLLAGAVLAVLLILVAVELHQDKVLNDIAMRENHEAETHKKIGLL